jgi:hypothetical protein
MPRKKRDDSDQDEEFEAKIEDDASSSDAEGVESEVEEGGKKRPANDDDFEEESPKKKAKSTNKDTPTKKSKPEKKGKKEDKEPKSSKKATGKPEKKASIRDVGAIEEMLLEYVGKHNRPHAVQSLLTAFRNSFGKASCEKALANLCKRGDVTLKQSGKAKVYYVAQSGLEAVSKEDLTEMDVQIKTFQSDLKEIQEEVKEVTKRRDESLNSLTTTQLKEKIAAQKSDVEKKTVKLASLQSTPLISDEDSKKLDERLAKMLKEWKSRKASAKGMLEQLADMENKKIAEVMEDRGCEPDSVDINSIGKL